VLPEGLYFGRVGDEDLDPLLGRYFDRELYLDRYRGRSAYTFAVQAAELAVREADALAGIDEVSLGNVEKRGGRWRVTLSANGAVRKVDVEAELADEPVYMTCGSATRQRPRRYSARIL
jgi:hypothetical protein